MVCRYPNDSIDRFWWRYVSKRNDVNVTTQNVNVNGIPDYPPMAVLQTNLIADNITINLAEDFRNVFTTSTVTGSHMYFVVLFFAEIDPRVNAPGQRVVDLTVNGGVFVEAADIYADASGTYNGLEYYTNTSIPLGPYSDNIIIEATAKTNSSYPAAIAGAEVLQLFDHSMNATTPTSSSDGMYNCSPHTHTRTHYVLRHITSYCLFD